jgi:hypothetical protein
MYALHDHNGDIRYVGITKKDDYGFYGRIMNRHTSGSEGRSHKFSHAYNTARMFRVKKDNRPDALEAKALRNAFARKYCRASFLPIGTAFHSNLMQLEKAVQDLAPPSMMAWGNKRSFVPVAEPTELLDALMDELQYTAGQRAAVERQAVLWNNQ